MECVCLADEVAVEELFGDCTAPEHTRFVSIDGGDCFSIGVDEYGAVVGWGSGFYGELTEPDDESETNDTNGDASNSSSSSSAATAVQSAVYARALVLSTRLKVPEKCVRVACGTNHVLAVVQQGNLYAWGWNCRRQVSPSTSDVVSQATLVKFPEAVTVDDVAGGGMHSSALAADGRVWSWGDNTHGQLGIGSEAEVHASPALVRLPPHRETSSIAAGWAHSALLTATGELFTFGWGLYHQLGHGTTRNQNQPLAVDALSGLDARCGGPIVQVACGNWHTAARTAAGDIYTWGWGRDGQLGHGGAVTSQALPRVVAADGYFDSDDSGHRALGVACGSRATLVLCANGDLHMWGSNKAQAVPSRDAWGTLAQDQMCTQVAMGVTHALLLVQRTSDETNAQ